MRNFIILVAAYGNNNTHPILVGSHAITNTHPPRPVEREGKRPTPYHIVTTQRKSVQQSETRDEKANENYLNVLLRPQVKGSVGVIRNET